jgi:hypothetical protein
MIYLEGQNIQCLQRQGVLRIKYISDEIEDLNRYEFRTCLELLKTKTNLQSIDLIFHIIILLIQRNGGAPICTGVEHDGVLVLPGKVHRNSR